MPEKDIPKVCPQCGVGFVSRRGRSTYCSWTCRGLAHTGEANPSWAGGKVALVCATCGGSFERSPCRVDRARYCSPECRHRAHSAQRVPVAARFWDRVDRSGGPDACWPWTASRDPHGRGQVMDNRKNRLTHRVAWELTHGPIPAGLVVCHSCDNPACCNPAHLWLGTQRDNVRDMLAKGRGKYGPHRQRAHD